MRRILTAVAAVVALVATTAGGCGGKPPSKFDRDCTVRGGHPVTVRKGHSVTRICRPPAGGWQ